MKMSMLSFSIFFLYFTNKKNLTACEEISSYLPHVTSVLPPVLLTGMPTLIMIVGTHLTSPNNSLLAVEFELPGGENRSCEILEPKSEQEIRCILEGVDQKKGTLCK